ncbi:hypothetical protein IMZ68_01090 [Candidatus Bathyarchaeota archaeon]|nr:hypothetical protein [Candidatus Bathyarchaeota archaeon]
MNDIESAKMKLIPDAILHKLIELGKSGDLSRMSSSFAVQEQHRFSQIMRLGPEPWLCIAESLSTEDLVALIKCLTIAERVFEGWGAGSVSPVIWLFRRLASLDPNIAETNADWVLANTENYYLPFGTMNLGAKSLTEYHRFKQLDMERVKKSYEAENQRQEAARQRKAQEATHALIGAVRRGDVKAVNALLAKGADANVKDSEGVSVREHARLKGNPQILNLLKPTETGE